MYIIWTQQKLIPFLSEKFVAKFKKKRLFFAVLTLQTANGNFLMLCQMVLLLFNFFKPLIHNVPKWSDTLLKSCSCARFLKCV